MSFAIFAGGPDSRNGFREATRVRPDSWGSRKSSTAIMDVQREGMNI